ncbi:MAG: GyrI-like domain-containing protein [Saprospiraceae bacterium]|jgi:AraC family transcriptional regulator|nr:AraC family transcriptional regulator [Saprospiraceae bacterium]MBK9992611.1 AraC family transcriptional regulator [Saprospiraceae bacterium]
MFSHYQSILPKILVGHQLESSFSENNSFQLWSGFMPKRNLIPNRFDENYYSVQLFKDGIDYFTDLNAKYTKWAAVQVKSSLDKPEGFDLLTIPAGEYAVFIHKGTSQDFIKTSQYIYGEWLPKSKYKLASRPHFEILGSKYKLNDPNSEEEVWIPIQSK